MSKGRKNYFSLMPLLPIKKGVEPARTRPSGLCSLHLNTGRRSRSLFDFIEVFCCDEVKRESKLGF